MNELELDPDLIMTLRTLETHRVEFVLVGDVAEAIYNHGGFVSGVAIVPGGYGRNVERLMQALHTLDAELGIAGRPDPRGLDWRRMDLRDIAPCTFMTTYADVDVNFQPAGTNGYRDLFQDAQRYELGTGARPHVAAPDDLERLVQGGARTPVAPPPRLADPTERPRAAQPPRSALPADEPGLPLEPDVWTEEEFRAIRAGRIPS
ncbi:MAG TPA: hypothetical protein VGF63_05405 [Solirubrobacteraceae bacterium]|jgi:hypothetical protein